MNGSIIDTNVITKVLDNDPEAINIIKNVSVYCTSSIVVGELYFAALKSSRCEKNMDAFKKILSHIKIISIDDKVCISYAEIKLDLKKKEGLFLRMIFGLLPVHTHMIYQ